MAFDIIGDVHGDAQKLLALLKSLGYQESVGAWRHKDRQAIFVGDFIDRGACQLETYYIVRNMVDAGSALAVMGNHEFNAIAWFFHLREHTEKNRLQHNAFLSEVEHTPLHKEVIDWFLTLPLWLELDGIKVVHACWHPDLMAEIEPYLRTGRLLDESLIEMASQPGTVAFRTIEGLLKGLELELPEGVEFTDKGGHVRRHVRVRWWDDNAITYRASALLDDKQCAKLPDLLIPANTAIGYRGSIPVFIGHYSLSGPPAVLMPNVACVDYYNKNDDCLIAYRWDGEATLDNSKFVVV